jgi:hypothetical protein
VFSMIGQYDVACYSTFMHMSFNQAPGGSHSGPCSFGSLALFPRYAVVLVRLWSLFLSLVLQWTFFGGYSFVLASCSFGGALECPPEGLGVEGYRVRVFWFLCSWVESLPCLSAVIVLHLHPFCRNV